MASSVLRKVDPTGRPRGGKGPLLRAAGGIAGLSALGAAWGWLQPEGPSWVAPAVAAALSAAAALPAIARWQARAAAAEARAAALEGENARLQDDLGRRRDEREWLRAIDEALGLGVVFCDADAHPRFANRAWLEMTGLWGEELGAESLFAALHPEDRARVAADWRSQMRAHRDFVLVFRLEGPPDDLARWVRARTTRVEEGEDARGYLITWEDISARVEAEETLQRARQAAEQASRAKSDFLAHMSHEIRTPLTGILGHAEMLGDPGMAGPERERIRRYIRRGGEHLKQIISDILDLTKIEMGKLDLDHQRADPWRLAMDVVTPLQASASEKGLALEVRAEGALPRAILTDPTRVRQILFNLVSNAIKFSEAGRVVITLALEGADLARRGPNGSAGHHAPRFLYSVADQGVGIAPKQLRQVFTPFQQGDSSSSRRYGGTGLGLSISRRLATALGGALSVQSTLGSGSTFHLALPVGEAECRDLAPAPEEDEDSFGPGSSVEDPPSLRGRVLLAEDSEDVRRIVSYYLSKTGVQMDFAENGRVVLEKLDDDPMGYDLILMDMQMPELDGYEATKALRRRGHPGPILALTAHAMRDDREKCLVAGCTDYLSKPIDPRTLYIALAQFLAAPRGR